MLFYVKCPSCSRILSNNLDKYYDDLKAIVDDPKMSKLEKETAGSALLAKYQYKKICCRERIMGLIPYHEIIVT